MDVTGDSEKSRSRSICATNAIQTSGGDNENARTISPRRASDGFDHARIHPNDHTLGACRNVDDGFDHA
jgi:hypothetical protein